MSEQSDPSSGHLMETAAFAARQAGAILLEQWGKDRQIQFKGEINLVTDADHRSEAAIVSILRSRFPEHRILAEEGTTGGDDSPYRWIVDPLDGTTNYAHRYPHFAVSVAVERDGVVLAGAVYDPILDEMFLGRAGGGASLNGQLLRVSPVRDMVRALLSTGFPYDRAKFDSCLAQWDHFVRRSQAVRRDGSAALDLCYVAAGRFDAFWEDHLFPWDMAAASLMVREAGGLVTDFQGRQFDLEGGAIVASNGQLHPAMLEGLALVSAPARTPSR